MNAIKFHKFQKICFVFKAMTNLYHSQLFEWSNFKQFHKHLHFLRHANFSIRCSELDKKIKILNHNCD